MKPFQNSLARLTISSGLILIICVVLPGMADGAASEKQFVLGRASESLTLNADGALLRWEGRIAEKTSAPPSGAGEIHYAGNIFKLAKPAAVSRESGGLSFTYRWPEAPGIEVVIQHRLIR